MFKLTETKQSLTGVIADSFRLFRTVWAVNIFIVFVYYIIWVAIQFVTSPQGFSHPSQLFMLTQVAPHSSTVTELTQYSSAPGWWNLVAAVLSVWVMLIFRAILVRSTWNLTTTGKANIANAFKLGFKFSYVYLLMILIYVAFSAALIAGVYLFSLLHLNWLTTIISILAALVFYYLVVKFWLVEAVTVIEECGFKAISRSWNLVAAGWWRTVGASFYATIFYVIMVVLAGVGVFLAIFLPGVLPVMLHGVNHLLNGVPAWFSYLYMIDFAVVLVFLFLTVPSMIASTQIVLINDLKHRSNQSK